MKIAFDIDGVVLKSIDVILDHINQTTGRTLRVEELAAWDLEPLGLDLSTLRDAVEHMYAMPKIDNYAGAAEALSTIYRLTGEPLLFITGRARPETARRQLEALPWDSTAPEMIVTGGTRDKRTYIAETGVDFIVEDDPAYLQAYLDQGLGVGLMLQPWNRSTHIPVTAKFRGWHDVEQWFANVRGHD
jgi:hypothetical protein